MREAEKKIQTFTIKDTDRVQHVFFCPGCNENHSVYSKGTGVPNWEYNGNEYNPTFKPSIKVTWEHSSPENNRKAKEFYKVHGRRPTKVELPYDVVNICHSYVTDGMIEFLDDCYHELKGTTVELPDYKD